MVNFLIDISEIDISEIVKLRWMNNADRMDRMRYGPHKVSCSMLLAVVRCSDCWLCSFQGVCFDGYFITLTSLNTLRPRQNGRHFADDTFKRIFMNENLRISINISLKFVTISQHWFKIMAWRRPGDKPLSEPMMVNLLTHKCVTRPQWVKCLFMGSVRQTQHSLDQWHTILRWLC